MSKFETEMKQSFLRRAATGVAAVLFLGLTGFLGFRYFLSESEGPAAVRPDVTEVSSLSAKEFPSDGPSFEVKVDAPTERHGSEAGALIQWTAKVQVLDEILKSGKDADPRLDQVLVNLSAQDKAQMEKMYEATARDQFNQRGTIAFLIARDLGTPQDVDFLSAVLREVPCESLSRCEGSSSEDQSAPGGIDSGHDHSEARGDAVTLLYPQLAVLYQIEKTSRTLGQKTDRIRLEAWREQADQVLGSAETHSDPMIRDRAARLRDSIRKL